MSFINVLLFFRTNPVGLPATVAVLLSYPMGVAWATFLPRHSFLNPGPFSIKEHVLICEPPLFFFCMDLTLILLI